MIRQALSFALLPLLAACATTPLSGDPAPEGSTVALGQPVTAGDVVLTPIRVTEDSRCPINARCVWAGRILVETRVDGSGWRETVLLGLGEPGVARGHVFNLVSAEPGQMAGGPEVKPQDYRFAFESTAPE